MFEHVACLRGGRLLFEGLSLTLGPGEAAIVTGPNGVGKSSLLRIAAGLLTPVAGAVTHAGRIALANENPALDREQPLGRALGFWGRIDGGDTDAAMRAMGLNGIAAAPVRMLSTGQRKRAALARVLASRADIWLLDEPANGLDRAGLTLLDEAIAAHRGRGGIVLAASHQALGIMDAREVAL